jgi:hypothetical protein
LLGFQYLQGRFVHHEEAAFATRLFGIYLTRPYAYHLRRNSAQLMHNVTIATASVFQSGLMPLLNLVMELFIAVGVLAAILIVSPVEGLTAGVRDLSSLARRFIATAGNPSSGSTKALVPLRKPKSWGGKGFSVKRSAATVVKRRAIEIMLMLARCRHAR